MENARRGFYCMICSLEGQEAIYTRKRFVGFFEVCHINYHQDFCNLMVDHAFPSAYNDWKNFNVYISNIIKMTTCFTSETNNLSSKNFNMKIDSKDKPPMSKDMKELIKNPLNLEKVSSLDDCDIARTHGIPFFSCKNFCKTFNIAKPVSLLDGDLKSMDVIFDYLMQFKKYFRTGERNLFDDDLTELEAKIKVHRDSIDYFPYFYKSTS